MSGMTIEQAFDKLVDAAISRAMTVDFYEAMRRHRRARRRKGAQGAFDSFGGFVSEDECLRTGAVLTAALTTYDQEKARG